MDPDLREILNRVKDIADSLGSELDVPQIVVVREFARAIIQMRYLYVAWASVFWEIDRSGMREFLPCGPGITTRRPIVTRLVHSDQSEWSEFGHLEKRFTDYAEIQQEIQNETLRVAGRTKGISSQPIFLTMHSPAFVDLILVDLPGLTTSSSSAENRLRTFAMDYLSHYRTTVLVVSPIHANIRDSEAMKLAQMGHRPPSQTLLVRTDFKDGVEIVDILAGDALIQTPPWPRALRQKGSARLSKAIGAPLRTQIKDQLPMLKTRASTLVAQTQRELDSLGSSVGDHSHLQSTLVLEMVLQFSDNFVTSINGTVYDISTTDLSGGSRIYSVFHDIFGRALREMNPVAYLDDADIRTAIRNSSGTKGGLFGPEVAFEMLMKPQIRMLEGPVARCVDLVYDEMVQICHACTSEELRRFPRVRTQLIEDTLQLVKERVTPTREFAQSLIDIESSYINTSHPELVARSNAARKAKDSIRKRPAKKKSKAPRKSIGSSLPTSTASLEETVYTKPPPRPHSALGTSRQADISGSAKDKLLRYFFKPSEEMSIPQPTTSTSLPSSPDRQSFEDLPPLSQPDFTDSSSIDSDSPLTPSFPSEEDPETALIRSLIVSYFDIVRESIEDLVPKVIMHSLVNRVTAELQNHLIRKVYVEKTNEMAAMLVEDESTVKERQRIRAQLEVYTQAGVALTDISRYLM